MNAGAPRAWWLEDVRVGAVAVASLAIVASLTSLSNGFTLDDVYVIAERPLVHSLDTPWRILTASYWQIPPNNTLWRPLGLLAFALQWALGRGAPLAFHAASIALYAVTSLLVFALARRVMPAVGALVAGLVFAAHPVHVESVGNVVGQLELWVAAAMTGAVLVYVRARQRGRLTLPAAMGVVALYLLGLGMKEHAVVLPALLLAADLTVLRDPSAPGPGRRERLLYIALVAITGCWLLARHEVVGTLAGDWPHLALRDLHAGGRGLVMLAIVPEFLRLFLWPARLYADYSPQYLPVHSEVHPAHLPGALILLAFAVLLWRSWPRQRALAFGLLWIPVSLALVSNVLVATGVLLAERTLFLATVGVALAIGATASLAAAGLARAPALARTFAVASGCLVLGLAAAHSAERQRVWRDGSSLITSLVVDAPENFRGHLWLGDQLMRAGDLALGEQVLRRAHTLWPEHDSPPLLLALRYHEHGKCDAALPLYDVAGRLDATRVTAQFGRASCLLEVHRLHEARTAALAGIAAGRAPQTFRSLLLSIDSALVSVDSVAANNWWLRERARLSQSETRLGPTRR